MKKKDVAIGGVYIAKVSGKLAKVRVTSESRFGGWDAVNLDTKRQVRIRGAQRLRRRIDLPRTRATTVAQAATEPAAGTGGQEERGDAALPNTAAHVEPQPTGQEGDETMAKKQSKKQDKKGAKKTAAKAEKARGACPACGRVVELPNGKGRCGCGQALFARGKRLCRITETPHGCVKMDAATTISEPPVVVPGKPEKRTRKRADGKLSGLDAAAQVLAEAGEPLDAKTMVERMLEKGLWATGGKTPAATIYAAIIREIAKKGDASRFRKVERGQFTVAK